jgi:hypothetical protein
VVRGTFSPARARCPAAVAHLARTLGLIPTTMPTASSLTKSKPPDVPDEVAVALCIYGIDLVPEEISDLLRAKPTHSHRLGEKKTPKSKPYAKGA